LEDIPLEQFLSNKGLTYEDLKYDRTRKPMESKAKALTLDGFEKTGSGIPVVSFFSGAGGVDLGFEAAGFEHVGLVEHTRLFCDTLRANRPSWAVYGPPDHRGDVSDREGMSSLLRSLIGSKKRFEGVFVGGPPCQPFSIASNQRFNKNGANFKRVGFDHATNGNLLFDYVHQILELRPRVFLVENVVGLAEVDGGRQLRNAIKTLEAAGYHVQPPLILNTENYGLAQKRRRLFIIGSRVSAPFHAPPKADTWVPCGSVLGKSIRGVANHEPRNHKAASVIRYMKLFYGQRDQLGRVDRLDPNLPAKTVIAGGVSGGGRSHLHPEVPRTLTVRECARLQSFPDEYVFTGPTARQFTQVGNAVPPVIAAQLAVSIRRSYFS